MPLERLTMLVVPAEGPVTLVVPRLEAAPARACPAVAAGHAVLATWEETEDPVAVRARACSPAPCRRASACLDRLWALHLLRLQAALPAAVVRAGVARPAASSASSRTPTRSRSCAWPRRPPTGSSTRSPTAGSSAARRPTSRAEVRERLVAEGHDRADFAIVGSGPNSASPASRGLGARDRRRRADRPRHRRTAGRLRQRHHADDLGHRRATRPAARTTSSCGSTRCSARPRPRRPTRSGPASPASGSTSSPAS